jgi:dihydrofolate reductase
MRKIRIIEQISLDGVIQAPGGRDEDGDYAHGGWAMPYFDTAIGEAIVAAQGRSFDLLLGRRTYDIFAGYWPKAENGPIADGLNAATKYVATHRPDSLEWGPIEDLGSDIMEGIRSVKSKEGPEPDRLGKFDADVRATRAGTGRRGSAARLPGLAGPGQTLLFRQCRPARTRSRQHEEAASSGVLMNTYRHVGSLRTETLND